MASDFELTVGKRSDHVDARRADLGSVVVEFGVGHRDTGGPEPVDDRVFASDPGDSSAKTCNRSGGIRKRSLQS
jgi:hypothetical protein